MGCQPPPLDRPCLRDTSPRTCGGRDTTGGDRRSLRTADTAAEESLRTTMMTPTMTRRVRKTTRAAASPPNARRMTLPTLRQRSGSTCVCMRVGRTLCSEPDMRQTHQIQETSRVKTLYSPHCSRKIQYVWVILDPNIQILSKKMTSDFNKCPFF